MLQFRRFLELFLLLQFQNDLWYRMVYIVIFNELAGIPYVALLVRPMVPLTKNASCLTFNSFTFQEGEREKKGFETDCRE